MQSIQSIYFFHPFFRGFGFFLRRFLSESLSSSYSAWSFRSSFKTLYCRLREYQGSLCFSISGIITSVSFPSMKVDGGSIKSKLSSQNKLFFTFKCVIRHDIKLWRFKNLHQIYLSKYRFYKSEPDFPDLFIFGSKLNGKVVEVVFPSKKVTAKWLAGNFHL